MTRGRAPWNHGIHYCRLIRGAVPAGARRAPGVGCRGGMLARMLRQVAGEVTAIDADGPTVETARAGDNGAGVEYVRGDFRSQDFPPASFDLIASVAALHHMGERAALRRMNDLLRPGGMLAVVGLARSRRPPDLSADLAAVPVQLAFKARRGCARVNAPTRWPPARTYAEVPAVGRPGTSRGCDAGATCSGGTRSAGARRCPGLARRQRRENSPPAGIPRQNVDKVPNLHIDTMADQGVSLTLMQPQARRDGSEVVTDASGWHRLSSGVPPHPLPEATGHAD